MSSKPLKGSEPGNERRGFVSRLIRHRSDNDSKRPVAATSPAVASPPHPADDNQWPPKARIPPQEIRSQKAEVSPVGTAPQPTAQLTSAPSKKNRRAEAETRLQNAATTLSESMSKSPAKVPETIGLQQLDNIKDVEGTAKQLESAVDRIIDAREIKVSAESRRLWKDCIQKWYKAMYPYVKVGLKGVKDFVPTPYGYVASAVLYLLEQVYDALNLAADLEEAIKTLSATLERIQLTEGFNEVLTESQLDDVYCAALILAACVTEYLAKAIAYLDAGGGQVVSKEFTTAKTAIDTAAQLYQESMGFLTATMTAELLHHDKSARREEILAWLWSGDYWKRHKTLRSQRVPDTGNWFVESPEFIKWKNAEGSSLLISLGIPGAGKSSIVIDNLRPLTNTLNAMKIGVIQFYFDHRDPNNQTADDVIRSFIKQLVYQLKDGDIPKQLGLLYDAQKAQGKVAEPSRSQFLGLLGELLSAFDAVYICIDAFDECLPEQGFDVLNGLQLLPPRRFRLFLTGRTYIFNTPKICGHGQTQIWLQDAIFLPISASRPDIEMYLHEQLQATGKGVRLEKIIPRIVEAISSQSEGQFLLASFQLKYLLGFLSQPKQLLQKLNHLPPTMTDIYDDIMQRINESNEGDRDLALKGLSWAFHTAKGAGSRPLTLDEILDLIATDIGDTEVTDEFIRSSPEDLLNACRGLLVVDRITNTVRFPHLTALEYLRTRNDLHPSSYLAQVCMTYLSFEEFETECNDWEELKSRVTKYKAAELLAKYWGYYTRDAQCDQVVQDRIFAWLGSEKKCRSMIQMPYFRRAILDLSWDWFNSNMISHETILNLLVQNGLALLCELFLDGKSPNLNDGETSWTTKDLASVDNKGFSPLHRASSLGYKDIVEILIRRGANINMHTRRMLFNYPFPISKEQEAALSSFIPISTPLFCALENSRKEVALFLIQEGAEVGNSPDGRGPFHFTQDRELVTILAEKGADVKGDPESHVELPLRVAAGHMAGKEVIRTLIDHGAEVNARSKSQPYPTALHAATLSGNVDAMEVLLEKGANIEAKTGRVNNGTALHLAVEFSQLAALKLLLEKGADINALLSDGSTVLHSATSVTAPKLEIVQLLVQHGANLETGDKDKLLPIHLAAYAGCVDIVQFLFDCQSHELARDLKSTSFGKTPVELLSSLLAINPQHVGCLALLGSALWDENETEKAIDIFQRLLEINPANTFVTEAELQHVPRIRCRLRCGREIVGVRYRFQASLSHPQPVRSHYRYELCYTCFSSRQPSVYRRILEESDDQGRFVRIPREGWWPPGEKRAG